MQAQAARGNPGGSSFAFRVPAGNQGAPQDPAALRDDGGTMAITAGSAVMIRPAGIEDAAGLATVYMASAEHHFRLDPSLYAPPDFKRMVNHYQARLPLPADAEILVAEADGAVVGWIEIQLKRPHGEPRMNRDAVSAEIDISVLPEYRSRGIGTRLLEAAEDWALDHGAEVMGLEVHVANVEALRFYQKRHGWRATGLFLMKRPGRSTGGKPSS